MTSPEKTRMIGLNTTLYKIILSYNDFARDKEVYWLEQKSYTKIWAYSDGTREKEDNYWLEQKSYTIYV
jgi:hypothetical protein